MCSSCRAVIAALCWLGRLGQGRQHVSAGRAQWVWPRRSPAWRTSITRRGPGGLTTPAGLMLRGNLTGRSSNLYWGPADSQANNFQRYILSYNKSLTFNQTKSNWRLELQTDCLPALQSPAGPGKIWSNVVVVVCKGKVCPACLPLPDVLSLSSVLHSLEACRALYWQPNTNMSTPLHSLSGTSSPAPRSWPGRMWGWGRTCRGCWQTPPAAPVQVVFANQRCVAWGQKYNPKTVEVIEFTRPGVVKNLYNSSLKYYSKPVFALRCWIRYDESFVDLNRIIMLTFEDVQ